MKHHKWIIGWMVVALGNAVCAGVNVAKPNWTEAVFCLSMAITSCVWAYDYATRKQDEEEE